MRELWAYKAGNVAVLEKLIEASTELLNPYVKSWKKQRRKVVGYTCTYVPEEIIYAAGILPYRMRGRGCTKTTNYDFVGKPIIDIPETSPSVAAVLQILRKLNPI